jgi:GxxExxY protein
MSQYTGKSELPYKHSEITDKIIASFYAVYKTLGYGFLEKVYENAMALELRKRNVTVKAQAPITVLYEGEIVGEYFADLLVADAVIVELKAAKALADEHEAQLLNYLKATPHEVGLLLNFGPEPKVKRRSFENSRKEWWCKQQDQRSVRDQK